MLKTSSDRKYIGLVSITFIIQIIMSHKLWLSDRNFPVVGVFKGLELTAPLDMILVIAFGLLLLVNIWFDNKWLALSVLLFLILLILQDVNRLQPWTYIYLLVFFVRALQKFVEYRSGLKDVLVVLIVALFFWSGVSKLNYGFLEVTYISILTKVFQVSDLEPYRNYLQLGFAIPLIEIATGFLLAFVKTRKVGVYLAIGAHLFIIYFVSPLGIGNDTIVIPWNLLMIVLELSLLHDCTTNLISFVKQSGSTLLVNISLFFIILIFPFSNLFGFWDNFLSFNLYSDKTPNLLVFVKEEEFSKQDVHPILNRFKKMEGIDGGRMLSLINWSFTEMHTPFYPEEWVIKEVCASFCHMNIDNGNLRFIEYTGVFSSENMKSYACEDLVR